MPITYLSPHARLSQHLTRSHEHAFSLTEPISQSRTRTPRESSQPTKSASRPAFSLTQPVSQVAAHVNQAQGGWRGRSRAESPSSLRKGRLVGQDTARPPSLPVLTYWSSTSRTAQCTWRREKIVADGVQEEEGDDDEDMLVDSDEEEGTSQPILTRPLNDLHINSPTSHWPATAAPVQREIVMDAEQEDEDTLQDEDDEDDDAEVLARLVRRAENMRNVNNPEQVEKMEQERGQHNSGPHLEGGGLAHSSAVQMEEAEDRRSTAIGFLEGLVVSFLNDMQVSLKKLNERDRAKRLPKTRSRSNEHSGTKRKKDDEDQQEGSGYSQCQPKEQTSSQENSQTRRKKTKKMSSPSSSQDSVGSQGIEVRTVNRKTGQDQVISFPEDPLTFKSDSETALRRMSAVFRVASLLHEAILTDTPTTKRDIYYKDVKLFKEQRTVDKIVDDLAATAGLKRADFCVCATSKGLVASGMLRIFLKTGEELSMSHTLATLIHPAERIGVIEAEEPISWILVVEKDAVFTTLCNAGLLADERVGHGAIVTGKGYPDLATLQLVSRLAQIFPEAGVHALVDADPHGIDILSNYAFGSQASRFSKDHVGLDLGDRMQWLGVRATEWADTGISFDDLLPLSDRDAAKAMKMLKSRPNMPSEWRRELCHMLHLNRKAEIEVVMSAEVGGGADEAHSDDGGGLVGGDKLVDYVSQRLGRSTW